MERFLTASFALLVMAVTATLSLGCYQTTSAETEYSGVIVKETLEDLPPCTRGKYSVVYYVAVNDDFWFCDGIMYVQIDLSGQDGSSCTVDEVNGIANIRCGDGSAASVSDGPPGADGADGADGMSCTIVENMDGTKTIFCGDGTSVTVGDGAPGADGQDGADGAQGPSGQDGADGEPGASCTVNDNMDGTYALTCGETTVTVSDGADGADGQDGVSCTVQDNLDGTYAIACGTETVTVSDGQDGADGTSCTITHNGDDTATIACDDGTSVTVVALCVAIESPEVSCGDGVDNDCDGHVDSLDLDCCIITEPVEVSCSDRIDNDCDGRRDEDDYDCCSPGEVKCYGVCTYLNNNRPNCGGPSQFLGSVSGDTGAQSLTDSYHGEKGYLLYVSEDDSSVSATYLSVQIDLNVPTGTDYDLTARCDNCANDVKFSYGAGNQSLILRWDEETNLGFPSGSDSGRDVLIEVVYVSAEVCADWTLTVTGNVNTSSISCSPR
jgi:hypothetical protein